MLINAREKAPDIKLAVERGAGAIHGYTAVEFFQAADGKVAAFILPASTGVINKTAFKIWSNLIYQPMMNDAVAKICREDFPQFWIRYHKTH